MHSELVVAANDDDVLITRALRSQPIIEVGKLLFAAVVGEVT